MGVEKDSIERLKAAIYHILSTAEDDGHCYQTTKQLVARLVQILKVEEEAVFSKVYEAVKELNESGYVISETENIDEETAESIHYIASLLLAEESSASKLSDLLNQELETDVERVQNWLDRYLEATKSKLSETQRKAVIEAVSERVFILTGGPGVGKTTTANTIIKLLTAMGKAFNSQRQLVEQLKDFQKFRDKQPRPYIDF